MKVQNFGLVLSAILLLIGIILYDLLVLLVALMGIALSGWGFVYPDKANVWIYRVQSNFAKDKLEKELRKYEQELKQADAYMTKFATTFDFKFPLQWAIDYNGNVIPATINELSEKQLKEPFYHFQELLHDEGIIVPDYLIQFSINHKVDQMRYQKLEDYIDNKLEQNHSPKRAIKVYAHEIGSTAEEIQFLNKTFTVEYLLQYLLNKFSKEDLELQLGFDVKEFEEAKSSIRLTLQEFTQNIERERRVNTMRGILYGKIISSTHKDCNEWQETGSKVMEADLKELFRRMGYEVKEPSTTIQGVDFIVKKINKKFAIKHSLVIEGTVGTKVVQEAFAGKNYWDCDVCIVISNALFSNESLDLASKLKVEIWDGKTLQKLLDKYWNQNIEYWNLLKDNSSKREESEQKNAEQLLQGCSHVN